MIPEKHQDFVPLLLSYHYLLAIILSLAELLVNDRKKTPKVFLFDDCLHTDLKTASKAPETTAGQRLDRPNRQRHRKRQTRRLSAPDRPGPRGPKDVFRWRWWSVRIDRFFHDVCGGARLPARNGTEGEKLWMTRKKT